MPETVYTPDLAETICERVSEGKPLQVVCKELGINTTTVRKWALEDYKGFSGVYARARELMIERMGEELFEIADAADDETNVQSAKLRIDTRKWYMSKVLPKRYGERLQTEHSGEVTVRTVRLKTPLPDIKVDG